MFLEQQNINPTLLLTSIFVPRPHCISLFLSLVGKLWTFKTPPHQLCTLLRAFPQTNPVLHRTTAQPSEGSQRPSKHPHLSPRHCAAVSAVRFLPSSTELSPRMHIVCLAVSHAGGVSSILPVLWLLHWLEGIGLPFSSMALSLSVSVSFHADSGCLSWMQRPQVLELLQALSRETHAGPPCLEVLTLTLWPCWCLPVALPP